MNSRYLLRSRLTPILLIAISFIIGYKIGRTPSPCPTNLSNAPKGKITSFLVIIVISGPSNVERRNAIRATWLKDYKSHSSHVLYYFVVGSKDLPGPVETSLFEESRLHGDLLLLPVFDTYVTLTNKLLRTFVHLKENVDFKYMLKVDDDSFARVPEILEELRDSNYQESLYWGYFKGTAPIFRHGKWAEPDYNLCDRYIPYALGGGYVLSKNLVTLLGEHEALLTLYKNEDISVGTWLAGLKVHKVHDIRFDTEYRSRGCLNSYLVSHKQNIKDMRNKEESLRTRGFLCPFEFEEFPSYNYNWKTVPSKCCPIVNPT